MDVPSTSDGRRASKRRRNEVYRYDEPNFEAKIKKCLEELEAEEDSTLDEPIDNSDDDPDYTQQSITHQRLDDSDESEYDSDTDENNTGNLNINTSQTIHEKPDALPEYFFSKNGFKWSSKEPPTGLKIAQHNIVRSKPGMTNTLRALGPKPQMEDIWSLLFDKEILRSIITWTNVNVFSFM